MSIDSFLQNIKNNFNNWAQGEMVFLFHEGRSGSTVLGDLLDQHPSVWWTGEVFERILKRWKQYWLINAGEKEGILDYQSKHYDDMQEEYKKMKEGKASFLPPGEDAFSTLKDLRNLSKKKVMGVEIKSHHLDLLYVTMPDFVSWAKGEGCKRFIILNRKNHLRRAVSNKVAQKNSYYHITSDKKSPLTTIYLDPEKVRAKGGAYPILEFLDEQESKHQRIVDCVKNEQTLLLSYEDDILADPKIAYIKTCEFLELPIFEEISIRYSKTNPYPLKEVIENYDEIKEILKNTKHEWMLEN